MPPQTDMRIVMIHFKSGKSIGLRMTYDEKEELSKLLSRSIDHKSYFNFSNYIIDLDSIEYIEISILK